MYASAVAALPLAIPVLTYSVADVSVSAEAATVMSVNLEAAVSEVMTAAVTTVVPAPPEDVKTPTVARLTARLVLAFVIVTRRTMYRAYADGTGIAWSVFAEFRLTPTYARTGRSMWVSFAAADAWSENSATRTTRLATRRTVYTQAPSPI